MYSSAMARAQRPNRIPSLAAARAARRYSEGRNRIEMISERLPFSCLANLSLGTLRSPSIAVTRSMMASRIITVAASCCFMATTRMASRSFGRNRMAKGSSARFVAVAVAVFLIMSTSPSTANLARARLYCKSAIRARFPDGSQNSLDRLHIPCICDVRMKKRPRPISDRTIRFNMMLSPAEKSQLMKLAKQRGLTASDMLRQWIRAGAA